MQYFQEESKQPAL